jgi:hypothetical protein
LNGLALVGAQGNGTDITSLFLSVAPLPGGTDKRRIFYEVQKSSMFPGFFKKLNGYRI